MYELRTSEDRLTDQSTLTVSLANHTTAPLRVTDLAAADVYGALGTGPQGEAVAVTHTWEDVGACLGRLIRKAAAALDDLTGDARDTVDERLRFLAARVAAWAGMRLS